MITTANREWDARMRLWRQHGMTVPDTARHSATRVVFEEYAELGFNYRMTDLQAAIGRVQLSRLPEMVARRRAAADHYRVLLGGITDLHLPVESAWARSNWQSFCVRLPYGCNQERVMQTMLDDGIATRRGVMCAHLEPAYRREPWRCADADVHGTHAEGEEPVCCDALQESEEITGDGLVLPLFDDITDADQRRVAASLAAAIADEDRRFFP
jgi:perosamine synthetase